LELDRTGMGKKHLKNLHKPKKDPLKEGLREERSRDP